MNAVDEVLSRLTMTGVCRALGIEPKRRRIRAPWRETKDVNVGINDEKKTYFDFVENTGGGLLDFVQRARGSSKQDALHFLADLAGVPLNDKPLTAADCARWARERREIERALPTAKYWQRTAILLTDEILADLKKQIADVMAADETLPNLEEIAEADRAEDTDALSPVLGVLTRWSREIQRWTGARLRSSRLDGLALVRVYQEAARREPGVTAGLVRWARKREELELEALIEYLGLGEEVAA